MRKIKYNFPINTKIKAFIYKTIRIAPYIIATALASPMLCGAHELYRFTSISIGRNTQDDENRDSELG